MRRLTCSLLFLVLIGIGHLTPTRVTSKPEANVAGKKSWPHPIPLRVRDGANRDLMVMTLGDVDTPLADGTYDPTTDEASLNDGSKLTNYYRDKLGVKYFKAIDKTN